MIDRIGSFLVNQHFGYSGRLAVLSAPILNLAFRKTQEREWRESIPSTLTTREYVRLSPPRNAFQKEYRFGAVIQAVIGLGLAILALRHPLQKMRISAALYLLNAAVSVVWDKVQSKVPKGLTLININSNKSAEEDFQKALDVEDEDFGWYLSAAEKGLPAAQNSVGECYYYSNGVAEDDAEAVKWYKRAADQGDTDAQTNLGECYFNGDGVEQNYEIAVVWYLRAADKGDADAQTKLGNCYSKGCGVPQNDKEAVVWYLRAANKGNAEAQTKLGNCYSKGRGVPQNYEEAVKWYLRAAAQGDPLAQTNLGHCCYKGLGVEQNFRHAYNWYEDAAKQGNATAKKMMQRIHNDWNNKEKLEEISAPFKS